MVNQGINEIRNAILNSNASWEASETSFTNMSEDEKMAFLGYVPGPEDPSLEQQASMAKANFDAFLALSTASSKSSIFI